MDYGSGSRNRVPEVGQPLTGQLGGQLPVSARLGSQPGVSGAVDEQHRVGANAVAKLGLAETQLSCVCGVRNSPGAPPELPER